MWRIESEGFEGQLIYKCDYHIINYSIYAFFVSIYRNSSARFFRAGAVSPYVLCSKKNISFVLDTAGDLPRAPRAFLDS